MSSLAYRNGVPQYTLADYERDFADRHLLHGAIEKWARETPDAVAIEDAETGQRYTYRQFDEITTALALHLIGRGFEKGHFLATSLPLLPEHIFLEYACFKAGVIHVPLDLRLKAPEVIRSLGLVQAQGYAFLGNTPVADFRELGRAIQSHCPYVKYFLQFSPSADCIDGARSVFDVFQSARETAARLQSGTATAEEQAIWRRYQERHAAIHGDDGAQVIYTTGSTGLPKPALLSHRNITSQNLCLAGGFGMLDRPKMLVNLPPSHVGCQAEQLMTTLFSGGTAVILHMFDAEKTLRAIQDCNVDCFGQIPAMFALEWRLPNYRDYDLSSLRFALYGGQQVSRQFLEQLSRMAPKFGTGLGLTEMAGFVTYSPLDGTVDDILASVGYDMPITPLSIRQPMNADGTAGDELPDGEQGEICFSGPQVFIAYVNDEAAYRRTVSTDGVCYTGDLGYKTDKGLMFAGRSKLVIKPKGYQVHPAQIEQHFTLLVEQITACAAVGVPHEVFSEGVVLFVEQRSSGGVTPAELESHAKQIAAYMRPAHYVLLEPGSLPLNRVAKTDYVRLKELALAEIAALRSTGGWDAG